jgi:hypothetical protein
MTARPYRAFLRAALACCASSLASPAGARTECLVAARRVEQACLGGRKAFRSSLGKEEKEYLRRTCGLNAAVVKVTCEGQGGVPRLEDACDRAVFDAKGLEGLPSLSSFDNVRSMARRNRELASQGKAILKFKTIRPARREKLVKTTHDGAVAWLARTCPDLRDRLLVQATGEGAAPAAGSDRLDEASQERRRAAAGEPFAPMAGEDLPPEVPQEQIQQAVAVRMDDLRGCLEKQQSQNPDSHGTLKLGWVIGPDGDVSGVRSLNSELEGQPIAQCLVGVVETIRFPRSRTRGQEVVFPFKF